MSLLEKFELAIKSFQLFSKQDRLLIALSGGVDSVVLCELCYMGGYDFIPVHCNFQLRGEESERDQEFVESLGMRYQAEVITRKFDTEMFARENSMGVQESARVLRYEWFAKLIADFREQDSKNLTARKTFLLTAHHADDNIETVLMRFLRGTGLRGLTGIPRKRDYIRRPLLSIYKAELLHFASERHLEFVEDSSNSSDKYTRNQVRHSLLPAVLQAFPHAGENITDNIGRFDSINLLYERLVTDLKSSFLVKKGGEVHIPFRKMLNYGSPALVYEIFSEFGFTERQVPDIIHLSRSGSGKFVPSPGGKFRVIRHRNWFVISAVDSNESGHFIIQDNDNTVCFDGGVLYLEQLQRGSASDGNSRTAILDAGSFEFPLLLRKWKTGDYFYPLGMKKKKKLARFFIDNKLSLSEKKKVWVLESRGRILWVLGYRIDERFRTTPSTAKFLRLRLE